MKISTIENKLSTALKNHGVRGVQFTTLQHTFASGEGFTILINHSVMHDERNFVNALTEFKQDSAFNGKGFTMPMTLHSTLIGVTLKNAQ